MHPDKEERRPGLGSGAQDSGEKSGLSLAAAASDATQARCARCGHPIAAPLSLATGYGKQCRRMLDLDPLEAVAR